MESESTGEGPLTTGDVTYRVIQSSSKRGRDKLEDSHGFTYTLKRRNQGSTRWRCAVRNNHTNCKATIIQTGDDFSLGSTRHCHKPVSKRKVSKQNVKTKKIPSQGHQEETVTHQEHQEEAVTPQGYQEETVAPQGNEEEAVIPQGHQDEEVPPQGHQEETVSTTKINVQYVTNGIPADDTGEHYIEIDTSGNIVIRTTEVTEEETEIHEESVIEQESFEQESMVEQDSVVEQESVIEQDSVIRKQQSVIVQQGERLPLGDGEVTYQLITSSSKRGADKLVDSQGYSYTVRRKKGDMVAWRCSVRNQRTCCAATVVQKGEEFRTGPSPHCHEPSLGEKNFLQLRKQIRAKAKQQSFRPATAIIEDVLLQNPADILGLPSMPSLSRMANRVKAAQKQRYVQYVIVRGDLVRNYKWPTGEVIAQACHASVAVIYTFREDKNVVSYMSEIDNMQRVVLEAQSGTELRDLSKELTERDIDHKLWIEQPENIATCLAVKPYPRHKIQKMFKNFKIFK